MPTSRGFTLLEMLVAIAIAAILLTIGVPSFLNMMAENQRDAYAMNFYTALLTARSEAITRNVRVVLCKSADGNKSVDGKRCTTSSGDYSVGWLVYANPDGDFSSVEPDDPKYILTSHRALDGGFTLTTEDGSDYVVYKPSGRAGVAMEFELCPNNPEIAGRSIEITPTGRPRITKEATCNAG